MKTSFHYRLSVISVILPLMCIILFANCVANLYGNEIKSQYITSPDSTLKVKVSFENDLKLSIVKNDSVVINSISVNLSPSVENNQFNFTNIQSEITLSNRRNEIVNVEFYTDSIIDESYCEYTLKIDKKWSIIFRLYNDTFAYRWKYNGLDLVQIYSEEFDINLDNDENAILTYIPHNNPKIIESQLRSSFQGEYEVVKMAKINPLRLIYLPIWLSNSKSQILITEVNLSDYPGLYLKKNESGLSGIFPKYPSELQKGGSGGEEYLVKGRFKYIADIKGESILPWRAFVVAQNTAQLVGSKSLYLLSTPPMIEDTSWIRPGKSTWDWWHNNDIYNVDFRAGMNTETYKHYIDFAHKQKLPYILIDAGWYNLKSGDPTHSVKDIDIDELIEYANDKNVGIFLWIQQSHINDRIEEIAEFCSNKGIKGLKIDIINRDDQEMNRFLYKCAEIMARYKVMLVYHGCSKPAGLNRTFPNVLSFENVRGLEQMKWESKEYDQVAYDAYLPYLRQIVGPVDYTPGAMNNASKNQYYPSFTHPMSQGTRAHQLAMYIVLFSPFSVLCDTPSKYEKEQDCVDFISSIPDYWDETIFIDGEIGEYIIVARRKGSNWYLGGITNWEDRVIDLELNFLDEKKHYKGEFITDGINSDKEGCDYLKGSYDIDKSSKIKVHMMPGGGFVGRVILCNNK